MGNHERLCSANGTCQLSAPTNQTGWWLSGQEVINLVEVLQTGHMESQSSIRHVQLGFWTSRSSSSLGPLPRGGGVHHKRPFGRFKRRTDETHGVEWCCFCPGSTSGDSQHCFVNCSSSVSITSTQRHYPACARVFQHSKSSCSFCGVSEQPQSSLAQSTRVFFILSNNYVLNLRDNFLDTKREFRWTFHWIGHSGPCSVYSLKTSALGICTDGEKQFCICQKILI